MIAATVSLGVEWSWHPSSLRGAVLEALALVYGPSLHSDWNGRLDGPLGPTVGTRARVHYRVPEGVAQLWLWGERAPERIAELGRISRLRTPTGALRDVEIGVEWHPENCGVAARTWTRYRLVTPAFPTSVQAAGMPGAGWRRDVWAATILRQAVVGWCIDLGIQGTPELVVGWWRSVPVEWRRDARGILEEETGILSEFATTALLPRGTAIGKHCAEGYGILEQGERWNERS